MHYHLLASSLRRPGRSIPTSERVVELLKSLILIQGDYLRFRLCCAYYRRVYHICNDGNSKAQSQPHPPER